MMHTIETATLKNNRVILIPAYEPDDRLISFIIEVKKMTMADVVVVNDGSSVRTEGIFHAAAREAFVLEHEINFGKGYACKVGMKFIRKHYPGNAVVVMACADGRYRPEDVLAVLLRAEYETRECVVLGSGQEDREGSVVCRLEHWMGCRLFHLLSGESLQDAQTGLRAFKVSMIPALMHVSGDGYEYDTNMLLACAKQKIALVELSIAGAPEQEVSLLTGIRHFVRTYGNLLALSLSSFACFLLDFTMFTCMLNITSGLSMVESLLISSVMSHIVSATVGFEIERNGVFTSQLYHRSSVVACVARIMVSLAVHTSVLMMLVVQLGMSGLWAKLFAEVLILGASFLVQKCMEFRKSRKKRRVIQPCFVRNIR